MKLGKHRIPMPRIPLPSVSLQAADQGEPCTYVGTWAPELREQAVLDSATRALHGTANDTYRAVLASLPALEQPVTHPPISTGSSSLEWATWHHGKSYATYWFGDVTKMLLHAHVTDTEREQLLLAARKAIARGHTVYATGYSDTDTPPQKPRLIITRIGLVIIAPGVYPVR